MAGEIWARLTAAAASLVAFASASAAGWGAEGQAAAAAAAAALAAFAWPRARPSEPSTASSKASDHADSAGTRRELGFEALARLPVSVLIVDGHGRIAYVNPAASALFERLRPNDHYSAVFRAPNFVEALNAAMLRGTAGDFEFPLHGDRTRHISAHLEPADVAGPGGDERFAICMFIDRTQEMRLARLRTDFVANASHELRTPLSSVKGFIETLQGPARDDDEARERFLAIMATQAERMERLVNDLLSLSRIELNEHIAPSSLESVGEIVQETVEAMAPLARRRGVTIHSLVEGSEPLVKGDRDQLAQAIGNLIENALKYGIGKPVTVRRRDASESYPGLVGISVEDEGEGIDRNHLPRLTERFYRVSVKRSRDQGGTGLGLAIVKHIVSRHRGELEIESAPGEGSRFTLWLPPAATSGPPEDEAAPFAKGSTTKASPAE